MEEEDNCFAEASDDEIKKAGYRRGTRKHEKSPKYALKVFEVKKKLDAKFCF